MFTQLKLLLQSGNPVISIDTHDEERAVEIVRKVAEALDCALFEWSITTGLVRTMPSAADTGVKAGKAGPALDYLLENKGNQEIYLFKDLAPHCREPLIQRQIRDVGAKRKVRLVLLESTPLPDNIRRLTVPVRLPLPDATELEKVARDTFLQIRDTSYYEVTSCLSKREFDQLVQTLRGLTCSEAARVVATCIHDDYALNSEDLPRLIEAKRNLLQATGCLESITVNMGVDELGGLANLKRWLARRRGGLTPQRREFGVDPPRGILLLGVQGCGKSLCARAVAADWGMPLLRMDPGVLYQKYIGESENRLRDALAQAEAIAPAVLWIDEIEKAFASASAESSDGGLSQRMFGTLLSWMQDHRSQIFMVATANNLTALPPELMRKGRFDEVFFVDLPSAAVRKDILSIHIKRRKREPNRYSLDEIANATEGFSGAELEQMVVSALYAAFSENRDLTNQHLLSEAKATRPLSVLMGEKIASLRAWAESRCVLAH